MRMSPNRSGYVIDRAMIDTGYNILSSVWLVLLRATEITNMKNSSPLMVYNQERLEEVCSATITLGPLKFFQFGRKILSYS